MKMAALLSILAVASLLGGCDKAEGESEPPPNKTERQTKGTTVALKLNPARIRSQDKDWQFANREIYSAQSALETKLQGLTPDEIQKYVLRKGNSARNTVALTFDDGPHPDYTPKLLAILKQANVKATFFVVGFMADRYPDLVKAIAADGHEVANHSYSHVTLDKIPQDEVLTEWKANNDVIKRLTGKTARYCRPPGGDFDKSTLEYASTLGLTTVLWTDDPGDYSNPGDDVLMKREIGALRPGAIILLHDGSSNTVDTLSKFIETVRAKGLEFVSLDDLKKSG